jgi:hypothetical protein
LGASCFATCQSSSIWYLLAQIQQVCTSTALVVAVNLLCLWNSHNESHSSFGGVPLGGCNPEYLRQFEELLGRKVFMPNVAGASAGIVGPEE